MKTEPRLRLADRFTHLVSTGGVVVLVEDEDAFVLDDELAVAVAPLLDGRRTAIEIADVLAGAHPPAEVHYLILRLLQAGLVREVEDASGGMVAERVTRPAAGTLASHLASAWLAGSGEGVVRVPAEAWEGPDGLSLVLADDYLRPELSRVLHAPTTDGARPTLLAGLATGRIWVGPTVGGEASCLACLQDRLRLNLTGRSLVHLPPGSRSGDFDVLTLPASIPDAAFVRLGELLGDPEVLRRTVGCLLSSSLGQGREPQAHHVPRLPHCPVCGDPAISVPGPEVELTSRPRRAASGGGYRIVAPEQTLSRYGHLLSPLVGVVRRMEKVPVDGAGLVHVYTASHAHHYGAGNVRAVKDDRRDHSGGKGRSDADARASALCESLERFSGVHRGDEPVRMARRSELGDEAYAPNDLMHFSTRQLEAREAWNASQHGGFQRVPRPYADEAIEWSEVRALGSDELRLVPAAFLFLGCRGEGGRYCAGDSNGLAGGNCLEEAILQGFLELVERDAIALWWYNRARRPGVDLPGCDDPWVDDVLSLYERLDRDVWALDLTTDLGVPTYAALSARRRDTEQDIIFGFGAHLDARIALTRALTELNQMLPTVLQTREVRRRRLLPEFTDAVRWWDEASVEGEPYLLPSSGVPPRTLPAQRDDDAGDLRDDVLSCVERAHAVGCEVLVHDLTRPDVGFPVAKVIVPGLRHFWRRLGPGRLYDVPVRLGWVAGRLHEEELNPVSMFV